MVGSGSQNVYQIPQMCGEDPVAFAEHTIQCRIHRIIVILGKDINHFQDILQTLLQR